MAKKKDDLSDFLKDLRKATNKSNGTKRTKNTLKITKNTSNNSKSSSKNNKNEDDVFSKAYSTAKSVDSVANKASRVAKKVAPKEKRRKTAMIVKLVVYFVFLIALIASIPFSSKIEKSINHADYTFASKLGDYTVHYIDVGQGDCTLIELPDNKLFMIDTGPSSAKNNLNKYLNGLNITTIDYLCFTHYDADHIGNGVMVFDEFEIKNVYVPKVRSSYEVSSGKDVNSSYRLVSSAGWNKVSESIYNEGCQIIYNSPDISIVNDEYGYAISFWMPVNDYESNANDYSPFILFNLHDTKYLFTGDASETKESEFLTTYSDLIATNYFDVDVFKLGHHGSRTSSSTEFLVKIKPELAIASCGANNKYGHPNADTLSRLQDINCAVKRTDEEGTIVLTSSSTTGKVEATTNFNHVTDFYLEWKYVLITGGILLVMFTFTFFVKKKKM